MFHTCPSSRTRIPSRGLVIVVVLNLLVTSAQYSLVMARVKIVLEQTYSDTSK
jgi:hypothetical protein